VYSISFAENFFDKGFNLYSKGNYKKAVELFQKACDVGNAEGCAILGGMYFEGQGVKQNYSKKLVMVDLQRDVLILGICILMEPA